MISPAATRSVFAAGAAVLATLATPAAAQQVFGQAPLLDWSYLDHPVSSLEYASDQLHVNTPMVLQARLSPNIFIWENLSDLGSALGLSWGVGVALTPRFDVRQLIVEDGDSWEAPVRMPSFRPGIDVITTVQVRPDIQGDVHRFNLGFHIEHYSNGQEGDTFVALDSGVRDLGAREPGRAPGPELYYNLEDGNFSVVADFRFRLGYQWIGGVHEVRPWITRDGSNGLAPSRAAEVYFGLTWYYGVDANNEPYLEIEEHWFRPNEIELGISYEERFYWQPAAGRGVVLKTEARVGILPSADPTVKAWALEWALKAMFIGSRSAAAQPPGLMLTVRAGRDEYNLRYAEDVLLFSIGTFWGGIETWEFD